MAPVRTLIVDDHSDVRFLIRAIVADAGADVEVVGEADGAEAALAQLEALAPDVVVLDARMPRVRGGTPLLRLLLAWRDQLATEAAARSPSSMPPLT